MASHVSEPGKWEGSLEAFVQTAVYMYHQLLIVEQVEKSSGIRPTP